MCGRRREGEVKKKPNPSPVYGLLYCFSPVFLEWCDTTETKNDRTIVEGVGVSNLGFGVEEVVIYRSKQGIFFFFSQ